MSYTKKYKKDLKVGRYKGGFYVLSKDVECRKGTFEAGTTVFVEMYYGQVDLDYETEPGYLSLLIRSSDAHDICAFKNGDELDTFCKEFLLQPKKLVKATHIRKELSRKSFECEDNCAIGIILATIFIFPLLTILFLGGGKSIAIHLFAAYCVIGFFALIIGTFLEQYTKDKYEKEITKLWNETLGSKFGYEDESVIPTKIEPVETAAETIARMKAALDPFGTWEQEGNLELFRTNKEMA